MVMFYMDKALFINTNNYSNQVWSGINTTVWAEGVTSARDSTGSNYYVYYTLTQTSTGFSYYVTKRTSSTTDNIAVKYQNNYNGYIYLWLAIG